MEQKPIPDYVKTIDKEVILYREYMLMDKETILKRQWEIQDSLRSKLKAFKFVTAYLMLVTVILAIFLARYLSTSYGG